MTQGTLPSIHDSGESALDSLTTILNAHGKVVRGPRLGRNAAKVADLIFTPTGAAAAIPLEVRKTGKSVRQMRPIVFKVVVVWKPPTLSDPDELLDLATRHAGQHCVSSFECMNPGTPSTAWNRWSTPADELAARIVKAHLQGQDSPLKALADEMRGEIRKLWSEHKERVAKAHTKGA